MRDFHAHPGHKFGEHLRKAKAAASGDRTLRGEAKPVTGQEGLPKKPETGSAGNRPGKATHPSGTTKHDQHKVKGKVRKIEVESMRGGHKMTVHYHDKKGKKGETMGYQRPEEHVHASRASLNRHMGEAIDNMEPEEMDSGDMAKMI